jgi:hypothetical protein
MSDPTASAPDPILAALSRIEARIEALEARLGPGLDVIEQAPAAIGTAIDIADAAAARLGDVDERLQASLALLERLSDPATLSMLQEALSMAQQAPGLVATGIDIADATFARARAAGVDVANLVPALESLAFFWGRTLTSPSTTALLQAAEAKGASTLLQAATQALQQTLQAPIQPVTLMGLVRALGDPTIQRTLGMGLTFLRALGAGLSSSHMLMPPPRR